MTLWRKDEPGQTWYPTSVASLELFLSKTVSQGSGFTHVYALRKNLAYNLQYLEFIDKYLEDLKLSSVLETQSYKMFVVVGCGVMESILAYLLIRGGHHKRTSWDLEQVMPGQEKELGGKRARVDSYLFIKRASPRLEAMDFNSFIQTAERKKVLGSNHDIYAKLNYLRQLRNKVHLHAIDEPNDTDWNAFHYRHLSAMGQIIYVTFTGNIFRPSQREKQYFNYLRKYLAFDVIENL